MNQAIPEQTTTKQRFLSIFLVVVLLTTIVTIGWFFLQNRDPYMQEVFSRQGDQTKGELIFQINCAACHGLHANGRIGPNLHDLPKRKSTRGIIEQVTSGKTPPMPKFQPNPQEMADLLVYLKYL